MIEEQENDYTFKDELIRNYISLIIHEALKLQPSEHYHQTKKATSQITSVFLELLERQFPIETFDHPLQLKTAQDYARTSQPNMQTYINETQLMRLYRWYA